MMQHSVVMFQACSYGIPSITHTHTHTKQSLRQPCKTQLLLPSEPVVSCPDCFFLCFGWGKRVWCNSNSLFVLNPQILGIVWRPENKPWTRCLHVLITSCSRVWAPSEYWTTSWTRCKEQQNIIDFIVGGLFAAFQTILRIWGFRTKRLLELHQTLFLHPKHRKKQSGQETSEPAGTRALCRQILLGQGQ